MIDTYNDGNKQERRPSKAPAAFAIYNVNASNNNNINNNNNISMRVFVNMHTNSFWRPAVIGTVQSTENKIIIIRCGDSVIALVQRHIKPLHKIVKRKV
ncbi:hypothetical protein GQX74_007739 [Glossina fuscipes]|uniref:Uncharacterized protein n=1 Tax=Glossina palpalis gambiensis TaxID=67801 RepID=A0A1B0BVH0_9MUSC|nr:hypothetical protein GQX74_007739 [Glossina fuscipes]